MISLLGSILQTSLDSSAFAFESWMILNSSWKGHFKKQMVVRQFWRRGRR